MPKSKLADPKPIEITLTPDPDISAKEWELLRRRVVDAIAGIISMQGLDYKKTVGKGDP